MKLKRIIKRESHSTACGSYFWEFTLECGHTVKKGGANRGGFHAYQMATGQKKAKCPRCERGVQA